MNDIEFEKLETLKDHKRGISKVMYSFDGNIMASCSADCNIHIYQTNINDTMQNNYNFNKQSHKKIHTFSMHTKVCLFVCFFFISFIF